jgi:hypothetical protein
MLHVEEEKALFPSSNTSSKNNVDENEPASNESTTDKPTSASSTNSNRQTEKETFTHEPNR